MQIVYDSQNYHVIEYSGIRRIRSHQQICACMRLFPRSRRSRLSQQLCENHRRKSLDRFGRRVPGRLRFADELAHRPALNTTRRVAQASLTSCLPRFSPLSIPMKAAGALSSPWAMVSLIFELARAEPAREFGQRFVPDIEVLGNDEALQAGRGSPAVSADAARRRTRSSRIPRRNRKTESARRR